MAAIFIKLKDCPAGSIVLNVPIDKAVLAAATERFIREVTAAAGPDVWSINIEVDVVAQRFIPLNGVKAEV